MKRGANCPAPDYGPQSLPEEQARALLVGNVVKLAERPAGVVGLHDQLRAVKDEGLIERAEAEADSPIEDRLGRADEWFHELDGAASVLLRMAYKQRGLVE